MNGKEHHRRSNSNPNIKKGKSTEEGKLLSSKLSNCGFKSDGESHMQPSKQVFFKARISVRQLAWILGKKFNNDCTALNAIGLDIKYRRQSKNGNFTITFSIPSFYLKS
jgi:hypothetical protein